MASTVAASGPVPAGSTPVSSQSQQSVVVLRRPPPPPPPLDSVAERAGSLKTLSSDLGELLVRNLSLKRNDNSATKVVIQEELVGAVVSEERVVDGGDSVGLIKRDRVLGSNRNSLCDTFSSVNKLIKLKRVSSDSSGSLGNSGGASINPPPQAKFKRVEVSVQEVPRKIAPRKSVIVNQLDQLELGEDQDQPLVILDQASSELPVEEGIARRVEVKVRRRNQQHPQQVRAGPRTATTLESVEEEQLRYNRRSLQWPLGLGSWGTTTTTTTEGAVIVRKRDKGDNRDRGEEEEGEEEEGFSGDSNGEERKGAKNHFRHSWNAPGPGYDLLLDDDRSGREDSRRDFASIVHNLAGLRSALTNGGTAHQHHHHHSHNQNHPSNAQNQHESASLLESPHSPQITAGSGPKQVAASPSPLPPSPVVPGGEGSLGGPVPRKRRLEAFLKSLVGRRPSKEPPPAPAPPAPPPQAMTTPSSPPAPPPQLPSPEIKISRSPSDHNLAEMTRSRLNISTTSLSSVHQRLWSVVPLLKKDVSCASLAPPRTVPLLGGGTGDTSSSSSPAAQKTGMRKCETVLALTHSMQTLEQQPIQPKNRLRNCASVATCSRCSSLLSLAAAGSRYSLNLSNGGFVAVPPGGGTTQTSTGTGKHVGSLLRLASTKGSSGTSSSCSANSSPCCASSSSSSSLSKSSSSSNSSSRASVTSKAAMLGPSSPTVATVVPAASSAGGNTNSGSGSSNSPLVAVATLAKFTCKLCLGEYGAENLTRISQCGCSFCTECMTAYVEFEISEGAYEVSCPDAMCPAQGIITIGEITMLASASLVEKHHRYRLNREVELDKFRTWCPKAGCETICLVGQQPQQQPQNSSSSNSSSDRIVQLSPASAVVPTSSSSLPSPCAVHCPTCREDFCSGCKKAWHPTMSCEENTRRLAADGQSDGHGIPFDNDLIKCCPMCAVPIEKDEGCAQMMCKRCKHVFCWYCLASLDDDFLLRHYDKGPCKNKLGHSRASVVWHRAQVIGIFAGFGILLLVASPLLLLAAPCIVCCKCRICSGAAKLEETEVDYDDAAVALQPSSLTSPATGSGR